MRKNVIKGISAVLLLVACIAGGCSEAKRQGTTEDEVLTLTVIPEDKLMLTMRMGDGMDYYNMESAIENQFPEVDIIIRSNTSIGQSIQHRDCEDIVLMTDGNYGVSDLESNFIDLSAEPYVQNYYLPALQESEVNGKLYYLPGPSNIYGIVYNKDMFREYGWSVPENLDEFIELCQEIESTGIRAIQPALYFKDAVRQFFTGFTYQPVFGGGEGRKWMMDYRNGNASMKGHMEPAFVIMDRLMEAGILRTEDFEMQPGTRSDMMYNNRTCAMILETQAAEMYAARRVGEDAPELGLLPFFSGSDDDSDYFLSIPIYKMAASRRLEEKGNEEKLKAVREIFAYLSTSEGQQAATGGNASVISSVKGIEYRGNAFLKDAAQTIDKGHVVPQPFFVGSANTEMDTTLKENLSLYVAGKLSREQFMKDIDQVRDQMLQNEKVSEITVIGTAEEEFSILQTSCLMGEIFRKRTESQIGLCASNTRLSGNNWKIYKGDIEYGSDYTLDYNLNKSFQHTKNSRQIDGKLVKVKMTGENIIKALNTPYLKSDGFPDTYFIASGLHITFAPWAGDGKRYVSVKLADGKNLNPDELYTVAFWNGSVDPELIETVEAEYEDTAADLFRKWVEEQGGSIKPKQDDFILDWKTVDR